MSVYISYSLAITLCLTPLTNNSEYSFNYGHTDIHMVYRVASLLKLSMYVCPYIDIMSHSFSYNPLSYPLPPPNDRKCFYKFANSQNSQ